MPVTTNEATSRMAEEARQLAVHAADRVRDHALPSAAVAAILAGGAGYLLARNARLSQPLLKGVGTTDTIADRSREAVGAVLDATATNGHGGLRGYADQVSAKARHLGDQARIRAHDLSVDARDRLRHATTTADRWAHDHPLALGAAAAAVGLAVGLAAPRTRIEDEDELMGEASDALFGRGGRGSGASD